MMGSSSSSSGSILGTSSSSSSSATEQQQQPAQDAAEQPLQQQPEPAAAPQQQQQQRRAFGMLLFSCNGRGTSLYNEPSWDSRQLAGFIPVPVSGFMCNGELGEREVGGTSWTCFETGVLVGETHGHLTAE